MTIAKHWFTGIPVAIASCYIKLLERSFRRWQLYKLHRLIYESLYSLGMHLGFCNRRRIQSAPSVFLPFLKLRADYSTSALLTVVFTEHISRALPGFVFGRVFSSMQAAWLKSHRFD